MRLSFFFLSIVFFYLAPFCCQAQATGPNLNESEQNSYYNALEQEVQKQDLLVQAMMQSFLDKRTIFSQRQRVRMEHAIAVLDVKRTLYANFYQTDLIAQSPAVRQMLLEIFSQPEISAADLALLQNLVQREKGRLDQLE